MAKAQKELTPAHAVLARWADESKNGQGNADFDAEFSLQWPNLWTFLTWTNVGDLEKLPGKITLQADGSAWRLTYFDPTVKKSATVTATTLQDALAKLDKALVSGDTVWSGRGNRQRGWTRKRG